MLEAKANLLHVKQDIPLTDDERAAFDDGLRALKKLCTRLADVPTPAGPTPPRSSGQPMLRTRRCRGAGRPSVARVDGL
jgi:hypothetical protein